MADQAPLKATFFALQKREPTGVLKRTSAALVLSLLLVWGLFFAAVFAFFGPNFYRDWMADVGAAANPARVFPPHFVELMLLNLVGTTAFFVLFAAYEAACLRWMIHGQANSFPYLKFDADTWRVYGTYWFWLVFSGLAYLGLIVLMLIVGFASGALASVSKIASAIAGIVGVLAVIAYPVLWLRTATRLAPAAATSIGVREFTPLKAWSATRKRFWALFGSYFLLILGNYLVFTIFFALIYWPALSGVDWNLGRSDPQALSVVLNEAMAAAVLEPMSSAAGMARLFGIELVLYLAILFLSVLGFGVAARAVQAAFAENKISPAKQPVIQS